MAGDKNKKLLEAADKGDLEGVKQALDSGANLNAKDGGDMSALSLAVRSGFIEVIKYLISKGIKITDSDIQTASMSAYSNLSIVKYLQWHQLLQVKPVTKGMEKKEADLLEAAFKGDVKKAEAALKAGANPDASDKTDQTALRWAARHGHKDIVTLLLKHKANPNLQSASGWTALMETALFNHSDITKQLLDAGANVNAKTYVEATALYFAQDVANEKMAKLLIERGADESLAAKRRDRDNSRNDD